MSAAKHTPGPLFVAAVEEPLRAFDDSPPIMTETMLEIRREDGMPVATVHKGNAVWLREGEAEANARLYAAAPDLLDVVETWMRSIQRTWADGPPITHPQFDLYNWAKNAVTKARGEQ